MDTKEFVSGSNSSSVALRQTKRIAPLGAMGTAMNVDPPNIGGSSSIASPGSGGLTPGHNAGPGASDLFALFECPVCFDYALPPITQCQNGHLVCQACRPKISCCPTCRVPIQNNIRNLQMEKLASTIQFPCKFSSSGCGALLNCTEKTDHEEGCEFKPYSCPCPG